MRADAHRGQVGVRQPSRGVTLDCVEQGAEPSGVVRTDAERATPLAGPEAVEQAGSNGAVVNDVLFVGPSSRARRPAKDPRCADAHVENTVVRGVPDADGSIHLGRSGEHVLHAHKRTRRAATIPPISWRGTENLLRVGTSARLAHGVIAGAAWGAINAGRSDQATKSGRKGNAPRAPVQRAGAGRPGTAGFRTGDRLQAGRANRRGLLSPCFAKKRRLGQRENYDFFSGHRTDVMVEAQHFHAGDFLDHRVHERPRRFNQLNPHLLE